MYFAAARAFVDAKGNLFGSASLARWFKQWSKRVCGVPLRISLFRESWITHWYSTNPSEEAKREMATRMQHSVAMATNIYDKRSMQDKTANASATMREMNAAMLVRRSSSGAHTRGVKTESCFIRLLPGAG